MTSDKQRYIECCNEDATNPVFSGIQHDPSLKQSSHDKLVKGFEQLKGYRPSSAKTTNYKWHRRFLEMCKLTATWSKDTSTKVGAVIVDDKQRVISLGYNGFSRGTKDTDERINDRDTKYALTIHAEMNAILFANKDLTGATLYCYPLMSCIRCAVMIIQAGIATVVSPKLPDNLVERWKESTDLSKEIFKEAGVKVIEI